MHHSINSYIDGVFPLLWITIFTILYISQGNASSSSNSRRSDSRRSSNKHFIVNGDETQFIQIIQNTAFIKQPSSLIKCSLTDPHKQYIIMNTNDYDQLQANNAIDNNGILIMSSEVFNNPILSDECKYPLFKILTTESLSNNQIKIYVTTAVAMTEYIENIDIDLDQLEMIFINPTHISIPSDIDPSEIEIIDPSGDEITYEEIDVQEIDYDIECIDTDCSDFDPKQFSYYLQDDFVNNLNNDNEINFVLPPARELSGNNATSPRRLFWSWVKKPVKIIVKKVIKPVVKIVKTGIQIVGGDVDLTRVYGFDVNERKSKKFKSNYKYKKSGSSVVVNGAVEIEWGVKFKLNLFAQLQAKWSFTPPKFEHFRFSVGGRTEFLTWFKAQLTASANINIQLFKQIKSYVFYLGSIPVSVELKGQVNFNLKSDFQITFMQQFGYKPIYVEFGIEYSNGIWKEIKNVNLAFESTNDRRIRFGDDDTQDDKISCPLQFEIKGTLIPRITISFNKLVHFSLETDFFLVNSYDIGTSCDNHMSTCDGIGTNLDLNNGDGIRLILAAGVDIFGISLKWEKTVNLGGSFSFPNAAEACFNLPDIVSMILSPSCDCTGSAYDIVLPGAEKPIEVATSTTTSTETPGIELPGTGVNTFNAGKSVIRNVNDNNNDVNSDTKDIVVSFSKHTMTNIWVLIGAFLVVNGVIAYVYCLDLKE